MAGLLFEMMSSQSHTVIQKDDPVLIVDMGGGTVDLTAMRMCDSGFKELVPGLGASCGSTMLDVAFLRMFRDVIGASAYDTIVEKNPQIKAKIRSAWERCKLAFQGATKSFQASIQVPRPLQKVCQYEDPEPVPDTDGATFDDGEFYLASETMQIMYKDIVEKIHSLVLSMLIECTSKGIQIKHILCVYGFSQSTCLVDQLRSRLPSDAAKVVV
ncbi:Heat shock 70 kDa protein 12A [Allomyces javanicus]|nr:Heat shock 70 kDa protein 12A [Allomyces javanicus]